MRSIKHGGYYADEGVAGASKDSAPEPRALFS